MSLSTRRVFVVTGLLSFFWTTQLLAQDMLEPAVQHSSLPQQNIAIIMDDLGYNLEHIDTLLSLAFPVTFAVLPHTPFAKETATRAHQAGRIVLLHIPMETSNPKYHDPDLAGLLHSGMTQTHFKQVIEENIANVPHISGINNHMGSLLTTLHEPMQWLMQTMKKHQLYFVDSRTTHHTVAVAHAQREGVVWAERKVFLDTKRDQFSIRQAWQKALNIAAQGKPCIVIAHPYPETLRFLTEQVRHSDVAALEQFLHQESFYADASSD